MAKRAAKPKTGRPKAKIDAEQVVKLARIGCTLEEIGSVVGCDKSTISRRFATEIDKGREYGKASLRRKMWHAAMDGNNITMMIFLSKNVLGMADKRETDITTKGEKLPGLSNEQYAALSKERGGPTE